MSEFIGIVAIAGFLALMAFVGWRVVKDNRRAAQIRRNRSDGAKRGAATRKAKRAAKRYAELEAASLEAGVIPND